MPEFVLPYESDDYVFPVEAYEQGLEAAPDARNPYDRRMPRCEAAWERVHAEAKEKTNVN